MSAPGGKRSLALENENKRSLALENENKLPPAASPFKKGPAPKTKRFALQRGQVVRLLK